MLAICIILYVVSIILLLSGIISLVGIFINEGFDGGGIYAIPVICFLFGGLLLLGAISKNVEGNTCYDKVNNVYSLKESNEFVLGIGDGYYYYNTNDKVNQIDIKKSSVSNTTLIQEENLEQPYIIKHKAKWKDSEYFLHVPVDVKIVQYTIN